jgi:hypothetical protein
MSDSASGETKATGETKLRWWRDVATLVAIVGLLVTMVFNTLGVRQSAASAKATRMATELSVLTALSSFLEANNARLSTPRIDAARCDSFLHPLSPREQLEVVTTLEGFDWLAWLFNQPDWRFEAARRYWAPRMLFAFDVAKGVFRLDSVEAQFAQLYRFERSIPHADQLIPGCPK